VRLEGLGQLKNPMTSSGISLIYNIYSIGIYIKKHFVSVRFIIAIKQNHFIVSTNCRALTFCINVSYVVNPERANSLLFQVTVYIL
jgi:hypothetical protein